MSKNITDILVACDAPDPDNFVMIVGVAKLFPEARLHVLLTGRPVRFGATKEHALWEWDLQSSRMALEASALRIKNFLRHFGIRISLVYDGGIAPRTLVPHHIHFQEYYKFLDVDPLQALRHSELEPQEDLIKILLKLPDDSVPVVVGGPMTGLKELIVRHPPVANKFKELHAMFATWGTVQLMQFGDQLRGALQFNVACDPEAANFVLAGLSCPVYLLPTEVTRVREIGFRNAQELYELLPNNVGTRALYHLYAIWYDAAVKPRQDKNPDELIYIHDLCSAFSLSPELAPHIYEMVPIRISRVPHLPNESGEWGKVIMERVGESPNRFAAINLTSGGATAYRSALRSIF